MADIQSVQHYNRLLTIEKRRLTNRIAELEEENERLKEQIDGFVCELRVCRFCANIHADCSPTDGSCRPHWRGL